MKDKVTTICYGRSREWESRADAINFFSAGVLECDGCEKIRYTNVLMGLLAGLTVCSD
jgi:hypothetical protein